MSIVIEEVAAPQQAESGESTLRAAGFSILLLVSGWLGGKMVYVHGVAVDAAPAEAETGQRPRFGG